jgi:hypothetical protein
LPLEEPNIHQSPEKSITMSQIPQPAGVNRRRMLAGIAAVAGAALLTACSGSTASPSGGAVQPAQSSSISTSPPVAVASPAAGQVAQKVNGNTASVAEMQRAFEAAGISSAARWAREVEEYRPYPTDDPSFAKLRRELAKYNPGPGVVDQIVATLTL